MNFDESLSNIAISSSSSSSSNSEAEAGDKRKLAELLAALEAEKVKNSVLMADLEKKNADLEKINADLEKKDADLDAEKAKNSILMADQILMSIILKTAIETTPEPEEIKPEIEALIKDIEISEPFLNAFTSIVVEFNAQSSFTEASGSMNKPNSIHHLWRDLFLCVQNFNSLNKRIVYEWKINNPLKADEKYDNSLDFTFIPQDHSFLSWFNYFGGLEAKLREVPESESPRGDSKSASKGDVVNKGLPQALSRAAMCVYERWRGTKRTGSYQSYCCFADSCKLSLARVILTQDGTAYTVTTGKLPMFDLPGYKNCTDTFAIKILVFLLTSSPEQLSTLITPPEVRPIELSGSSWKLGQYIGSGGFGIVFCDANGPYVIKTIRLNKLSYKLSNEAVILRELAVAKVACVPFVHGECTEDANVIALKLGPKGIPLEIYINEILTSDNEILELIRVMGPSLVRTLHDVHLVGIAHNDVRRSNILIIPPENIMGVFFNRFLALRVIPKELFLFNFDQFKFYLIDWGNATKQTSKPDLTSYPNDLNMLVSTIFKIKHKIDLTPSSGHSKASAFSQSKKPKAQSSGHKVTADPFDEDNSTFYSSIKQHEELARKLAETVNYLDLIALFTNLGR